MEKVLVQKNVTLDEETCKMIEEMQEKFSYTTEKKKWSFNETALRLIKLGHIGCDFK